MEHTLELSMKHTLERATVPGAHVPAVFQTQRKDDAWEMSLGWGMRSLSSAVFLTGL